MSDQNQHGHDTTNSAGLSSPHPSEAHQTAGGEGVQPQATLFPFVAGKLTAEDIARLVMYSAIENGPMWRVSGIGGRRSGDVGQAIGIVGLKHEGGYEVVLRFSDGKIDTFSPLTLFPAKLDS